MKKVTGKGDKEREVEEKHRKRIRREIIMIRYN